MPDGNALGRRPFHTTRRPFRYRDVGTLAIISRLRAVAVVGKRPVSGSPAWVLWLLVRFMMLAGFTRRLSVLFNWTVAFLGRGRQERVVTVQQVFARHALERGARESGVSGSQPLAPTN